MLVTTFRSWTLVGAVGLTCSSRAVDLLYDNLDPFASTGVFVGADDFQGGDRLILPNPAPGTVWHLVGIGGHMGGSVTGTYTDVTPTITVYRTVNLIGAGPAFSDPLGSTTIDIGGFTASGPGQGVDFIADISATLSAAPTDPSVGYGISISFAANGPGVVVPHYRNQHSTVPGSFSSQGWYRDLDDDGVLAADEYEVFAPWAEANLMLEVYAVAVPVPEPTSALALLVPFGALAFRRRKASGR